MNTTIIDTSGPTEDGVPTCKCGHIAKVHDYADAGLFRAGCSICDCKRSRLMVRLIAVSASYRSMTEEQSLLNPNWRREEEARLSATAQRLRAAYEANQPTPTPTRVENPDDPDVR